MTDALIGLGLAAATMGGARLAGLDRDGAFYPTVLVVVALLYVLFGAVDGRPEVVASETATALVFVAVAVAGFKHSPWWLVAGFALHGGWDVVHDTVVSNDGVPAWWPELCLAYDFAVAAWLTVRTRAASV